MRAAFAFTITGLVAVLVLASLIVVARLWWRGLSIGTKSVLAGAHCWCLHPWFVALGWWKLYGFAPVTAGPEWQRPRGVIRLWYPWLWIAFFVHDIGYIGKPNMDGPEGEEHPWTGARIMFRLQAAWLFVTHFAWCSADRLDTYRPPQRWELRRRWALAHLAINRQPVIWGNEVLYHSRFLAKKYRATPSRLCIADKLAIVLTPGWLYLPMVNFTGEISEYMAKSSAMNGTGNKYSGMNLDVSSQRAWMADCKAYVARWVEEHKDGRIDTWTPATKTAVTSTGVLQ